MRRRVLLCPIWSYTVRLCPIKRTPDLYELMNSAVNLPMKMTGRSNDEIRYIIGVNKKIAVFPLTRPTLNFTPTLQCLLPIKIKQNYFHTDRPSTFKRHLSRLVGKPTICIGENKGADQLRGNREVDRRLCFRYSDSIIPLQLNPKFQASSSFLCLYRSVCVGPVRKPHCWFSHEAAHLDSD